MDKKIQAHWKDTHAVSTYEVDHTNRVRLSSVFNYMQEAASHSATHLGWGYNDLKQEGLFWVLSRAKVIMLSYPKVGETLTIDTWPKKLEGIFAVRDFRISGVNSETFGLATTCWLLIDARTMRPRKPGDMIDRFSLQDPESAIQEIPAKIAEPGTKRPAYEKQIRYVDIDVNQHVNNVRHIESILDCFLPDRFAQRMISSIQVNYLDELKYGDILRVSLSEDRSVMCYIDGVDQHDNKIFQSLVEWREWREV